jgi:hypothetical protein
MKMRISRDDGALDATYPVARIRSIIPRILRRYSLCRGSDRPTPRGSGVGSGVGDAISESGVVVKELREETDEVLLPWGREGIEYLGNRPGQFYGCW